MAAHSEDFVILTCGVLTQYCSVTNRRTDRRKNTQAMAKMREALHAVVCKNQVKPQVWHNDPWPDLIKRADPGAEMCYSQIIVNFG